MFVKMVRQVYFVCFFVVVVLLRQVDPFEDCVVKLQDLFFFFNRHSNR